MGGGIRRQGKPGGAHRGRGRRLAQKVGSRSNCAWTVTPHGDDAQAARFHRDYEAGFDDIGPVDCLSLMLRLALRVFS